MSSVIAVLKDVRQRLADPRAWLQGLPFGYRDANGVLDSRNLATLKRHNCWCLGEALTLGVNEALGQWPKNGWTELRSDVEMQLLLTLGEGDRYAAAYQFNDAKTTAHADVLALLDATLQRLEAA